MLLAEDMVWKIEHTSWIGDFKRCQALASDVVIPLRWILILIQTSVINPTHRSDPVFLESITIVSLLDIKLPLTGNVRKQLLKKATQTSLKHNTANVFTWYEIICKCSRETKISKSLMPHASRRYTLMLSAPLTSSNYCSQVQHRFFTSTLH